jgi:MFS family permease
MEKPSLSLSADKPLDKSGIDVDTNPPQSGKEDPIPSEKETGDDDQNDAEGPEYPGKLKLILIVLSLNLAMFLVGLDNTIISPAIPKITDDFDALSDAGWYASAYLLTNCAFQLIWGKLYTFYVVKWIYLIALFLFELGSLICGVAPTSTALIVGRAIAGIGGGGVSNGSFLLIAHSVPPRQRPTLIGMMGAMYGFAAIAGPLMGGAFTDNDTLTWRWCFYINLPLGVVPALIIWLCIPAFAGSKKGAVGFINQLKQMDLPGSLCLLPGVICLLIALQWGGTRYAWDSARIVALLVLAGVLFVAFIVIQYFSGDRATVPRRVFSNRNVWGSSLFGSCVVAGFFMMLYYVRIPVPA